jgi:hypothetical protein
MRNTAQVRYSIRESKSRRLALNLNIRNNKEVRTREREHLRLLPPPSAAPLRGRRSGAVICFCVGARVRYHSRQVGGVPWQA